MFDLLKKMFKIYKFAASSTLADGTEIRIDGNGDTGSVVYVMTPDGEILCPPGEYTLENGDLMEVGDNGIIVKVTPKEEVEVIEEPIEETKEELTSEPTEAAIEPDPQADKGEELFNKVSDLEARITELETKIASLVQASEETKITAEQLSKQTNEIYEVLDKTSTAIELKKNDAEPELIIDRLNQFGSKKKTNLSSFEERLKK